MERLSPQVKVLHCLTVKEQEAQSKGGTERRGPEQPSARQPVRNTSEHDSARQVGETASPERSQVRLERNQWDSPSTEKGRCWACRVVGGGMGVEVISNQHGRPASGLRSGVHAGESGRRTAPGQESERP